MTSINERQLRRKIFFSKEPQEVFIKKFQEDEQKFQEDEQIQEKSKRDEEDKKRIEQLKLIREYKTKQPQQEQEEPIQNNNIQNNNLTVVIAHYNENLDWIRYLEYPYIIISRNGLPREKAPNKGNEASSYLEYIINNYDNLSEYTVFVHGHRTSWHHVSNIDEKINNLLFDKPYYNINELNLNRYNVGDSEYIKMLEKICHISYDIRNKHTYRAGAQFYVHKNNILCNSKQSYIELYNFLMNTTLSSAISGRFFEYSWHIIFTHQINDIE